MKADDSTRYLLISALVAERFEVELSLQEFADLDRSRGFLIDYMKMEEAALQLIYALQELESFLLDTALSGYLFPLSEYNFHRDQRIRADLRLQSFLNSMTSLRDQFPKFKAAKFNTGLRSEFGALWQASKVKNVTFGFCERLRNFAQHQTKPVEYVTTGGKWDEKREYQENYATLFVDVESVLNNRDLDNNEATLYRDKFGKKADLILVVREAASCVSEIIRSIRLASEADFNDCCGIYKKFVARSESAGAEMGYCELVVISGDEMTKRYDVFSEFVERATALRRVFLTMHNHNHFVSGKPRGHIA